MRQRAGVALAITLIIGALLLIAVSAVPASWWPRAPAVERAPLAVDSLVPPDGRKTALPKSARRERSGYLTIVTAPATATSPPPDLPPRTDAGAAPGPAVAPAIAPGIRLFATQRPVTATSGEQLSDLIPPPKQFSTVILRDGCFRLAEPGDPNVVFTVGTRLFLDRQGYLVFGQPAEGSLRGRIGEPVWWEGEHRTVRDRQSLARIRARCGPGPVQIVGLAQSVAVGEGLAAGAAAKRFSNMYGVPWAQALAAIKRCNERLSRGRDGASVAMIDTPCGSTPPRPVARQQDCPPGTRLSSGLCRTPEGYVRPIPPL